MDGGEREWARLAAVLAVIEDLLDSGFSGDFLPLPGAPLVPDAVTLMVVTVVFFDDDDAPFFDDVGLTIVGP